MVKKLSLLLILCFMLNMVGCGKKPLPDTQKAIKAYFTSLQSMEGELAQELLQNSLALELAGDPAQEEEEEASASGEDEEAAITPRQAYEVFIQEYLNQIQYKIIEDKTEINKRDNTAHVVVSMSIVDIKQCLDKADGQLQTFVDEIMASGRKAEETEKKAAMIQFLTEAVKDSETPRLQGDQILFLSYNAETEAWVVDNAADIAAQFKF